MWLKRWICGGLFLVTLLISFGSTAHAQTVAPANGPADFYVSPQGNDKWSGTLPQASADQSNGPFATLDRAVQAARDRKTAGQPSPVIMLRSGTYLISKRIELSPDDTATADHPLKFAAYPGEQPIIDGGEKITGTWQKTVDQPSVWSIQLPNLPRPVEDLFVNGKQAPCARFPDTGFLRALKVPGDARKKFAFKAGELKAWPDAANGRVTIKSFEWNDETIPIASIDEQALIVTLAKGSFYPLAGDGAGKAGDYFIVNIREALDQPGEWSFDATQHTLYYWPPDGVDPNHADILAGNAPVLINVQGDMSKSLWVEHLIFDGLTFAHAGRFKDTQFTNGTALSLGGGVKNCEIRNCHFIDDEGCGLMLWKECQNCIVSGNEFSGIGETPIRIFDYLGEGPPANSGHVVENNVIHDSGTVVGHISGIEVYDSGDNHIDHNLIYSMPYTGITVDGERPSLWPAKATPNLKRPFHAEDIKPFVPTKNNIIEFNHIHHIMLSLGDGGGIYLWGVMGGPNIVRNNLVEHVGEGIGNYIGLYLDDECDDVQATNNIFIDTDFSLQLHGASRDVIENNIFAYSRQGDIFVQPEQYNTPPMQTVIRKNIFYGGAASPFFDTSWAPWKAKLPLGECDHNLYWQDGKSIALGQGTFAGFDANSQVADPGFQDPQNGDFSLRLDSPATTLGFQEINLKGVGLLTGAPTR
jgi:hypothetical protein